MPPRLVLCLCAAFLLVVLAAAGQSATPTAAHWQGVLAAGDRAQPVFDNAVAALSDWLLARGVPPGDIHRLSASPAPTRMDRTNWSAPDTGFSATYRAASPP